MPDLLTAADVSVTVNAGRAATAWLNAFLAHSEEESRPALCRTLSVEFFREGVQFIGCDGTILLRAWVPAENAMNEDWPEIEEVPDMSVVVMDPDKFALAFMRTLGSAAGGEGNTHMPVTLAVEPSILLPEGVTVSVETDSPLGTALGAAFESKMLTLSAFGQRLHCRLYEAEYPKWRQLQYGLSPAEQVDGMKLALRMFATVGKLKSVSSVDCAFLGATRQINITAKGDGGEVRGLMMPMRRTDDA